MTYRVYMRLCGLPDGQHGAHELGTDYPTLEAAKATKDAFAGAWPCEHWPKGRYYIRKVAP